MISNGKRDARLVVSAALGGLWIVSDVIEEQTILFFYKFQDVFNTQTPPLANPDYNTNQEQLDMPNETLCSAFKNVEID